jgi:FlaA1/EpsC-like NDP-sugar epimerase
MKVNYYRILLALFDAVIINISLVLALYIRFDGALPAKYFLMYKGIVLPLTFINLISFYIFGLYSQIWAYASIGALLSIVGAAFCGTVCAAAYMYLSGLVRFPFWVLITSFLITTLLLGGSRFSWRIARERIFYGDQPKKKRALIFGAGDAGESMIREMIKSNGHCPYLPVGLIDDDQNKRGMTIHGLKVFGGRKDIPEIIKRRNIEEIIIAIPSADSGVIREIVNICNGVNIKYKTLPAIYELFEGKVTISQIREVNEEDILGRKPIRFDDSGMSLNLKGRVILVTGAGGSIGSELCRQISRFSPSKLVLFGHGENSIFNIDHELKNTYKSVEIIPVIGNIRDKEKVRSVITEHKPSVVFHSAAYKHVGMMEKNPHEAYLNNVLGTRNVAEACIENSVERFVLISTDKAVNPTSVMGNTKRQAELLVQALSKNSKTRLITTRFGNVINSRGSVIPIFQKQINERKPITVTHPDVVRFFMTIPEAVQLVLRAAFMGEGGEVFVLDMGEPVKILDIAKELISLSGLKAADIPIEFIGLRKGEKLFEELNSKEEKLMPTPHKKIRRVVPMMSNARQAIDL